MIIFFFTQKYPVNDNSSAPHPLEIAELFRTGGPVSNPIKVHHTTEGLVKLLMYGDYVKSRSSHEQVSIQSILESELTKYPYMRKDPFKVILMNM